MRKQKTTAPNKHDFKNKTERHDWLDSQEAEHRQRNTWSKCKEREGQTKTKEPYAACKANIEKRNQEYLKAFEAKPKTWQSCSTSKPKNKIAQHEHKSLKQQVSTVPTSSTYPLGSCGVSTLRDSPRNSLSQGRESQHGPNRSRLGRGHCGHRGHCGRRGLEPSQCRRSESGCDSPTSAVACWMHGVQSSAKMCKVCESVHMPASKG